MAITCYIIIYFSFNSHQFSCTLFLLLLQQEQGLLQFHLSNLEYACGCSLDKPSALHWDQNEAYPQFLGEHLLLQDGYSSIIEKLACGLDVSLSTEVSFLINNNCTDA